MNTNYGNEVAHVATCRSALSLAVWSMEDYLQVYLFSEAKGGEM